ncbi:MAG: hypothetical protein IJ723_08265 [Ruminococcus sp.]|nr:hypothetical protein [Ruminococcus sp.]
MKKLAAILLSVVTILGCMTSCGLTETSDTGSQAPADTTAASVDNVGGADGEEATEVEETTEAESEVEFK